VGPVRRRRHRRGRPARAGRARRALAGWHPGAAGLTDGAQAGAVHNDLVRIVVVPGGGHCVRRDQSARYLRPVDAFFAEVARA